MDVQADDFAPIRRVASTFVLAYAEVLRHLLCQPIAICRREGVVHSLDHVLETCEGPECDDALACLPCELRDADEARQQLVGRAIVDVESLRHGLSTHEEKRLARVDSKSRKSWQIGT